MRRLNNGSDISGNMRSTRFLGRTGFTYQSRQDTLLTSTVILLHRLSAQVESQFRKGKGDELGNDAAKGKMLALHSSSALVVNFFSYWRDSGRVGDLCVSIGLSRRLSLICNLSRYSLLDCQVFLLTLIYC